jgi:hypothetical protein
LRRGRASFAVAILFIVLPILLGLLPKPAATAEFLLLRDLATGEICSMPGSGPVRGQPMQHQPDCILCSTACPYTGSAAAPPAEAIAEPFLVQLALAGLETLHLGHPIARTSLIGMTASGVRHGNLSARRS